MVHSALVCVSLGIATLKQYAWEQLRIAKQSAGPSMSSAVAVSEAAGAKDVCLDTISAGCADLSVRVLEGSALDKRCSFDYVGSIKSHPQLSEEEVHSLLWLLAQAPAFHGLVKASDLSESHELPDWVKCAGMMGVHISRQDPEASERVYKMRGVTEVPASTEVRSPLSPVTHQPPDLGTECTISINRTEESNRACAVPAEQCCLCSSGALGTTFCCDGNSS